jgi:heat shock protein HslJ
MGATAWPSGEALTIAKDFTTMMTCESLLMTQEKVFLDALSKAQRFALGPNGAPILHTRDGRTITARRE